MTLGLQRYARLHTCSTEFGHQIVNALQGGRPRALVTRIYEFVISSVKRHASTAKRDESLAPKSAPSKRHKLDKGSSRIPL